MIGPPLRLLVEEGAALDDPAEIELAAAELIPRMLVEEGPPGALDEVVSLIAAAPGGRRMLRAMAAAALPPLSEVAADAVGKLREAGDVFGLLQPERAWLLDADEDVLGLFVTCRRPGIEGLQVFALTVEVTVTGGALKDAFATPTLAEREVQELVARSSEFGVEPKELDCDEAMGLAAAAARRCVEVGLGPAPEALPAVALLLRAGGVPDAEEVLVALASLPILAEELDDAEMEEEEIAAEIDAITFELRGWCAARGLRGDALERTVWIGGLMAEYRLRYADGRLAAWDVAGLRDFLLDWVPRKAFVEDEDVEHVCAGVAETLCFLGATGRLARHRAEMLSNRARALAPEFERAARDPRRFGLAKGIAMAMRADGIDLADPTAVEAWIEGFNALTREEREQRVPVIASLPEAPPAASSPPRATRKRKAEARKKKKAERQARRTSRGRS